jgi:molybdopterin converting factor small subunit
MLEDDAPKIYGLDNIKTGETVYVTEGPFDSTFISNSIAMCGADGDVSKWGITNPVWIYDNEPRNRQIVERLATTINRGDRVVIFPKNILEKDINDMYLSGQNVQRVVESNIYQGLEAKLKLQDWKRV